MVCHCFDRRTHNQPGSPIPFVSARWGSILFPEKLSRGSWATAKRSKHRALDLGATSVRRDRIPVSYTGVFQMCREGKSGGVRFGRFNVCKSHPRKRNVHLGSHRHLPAQDNWKLLLKDLPLSFDSSPPTPSFRLIGLPLCHPLMVLQYFWVQSIHLCLTATATFPNPHTMATLRRWLLRARRVTR